MNFDLGQVVEFLIFPAIGWLMLNSKRTGERLTRIETALEILVKKYPHNNDE